MARARLARGQPDPLDPIAQAGAEAADREARYAALWLAIELRWGGGDTDAWSPTLNPAAGGGVVGRGANGLGRSTVPATNHYARSRNATNPTSEATTSGEPAPVARESAESVGHLGADGEPRLCRRCLLEGVSVPVAWRCRPRTMLRSGVG